MSGSDETAELDGLMDVYIAGGRPTVPERLRKEFERAAGGYDALQRALGETIVVPEAGAVDRPSPVLPKDYLIVRELGRGGMGVVYLARQESLDRFVAVKVLRPGETTFRPVVRRFLEEARHLAHLRHANIVSVHEVGEADGEPYFTMDYIDGRPLSAILRDGVLAPSRALAIIKQAAEAIAHAHAQGIIHRDLKPGNILVDATGRAFVTDFGLARDMTRTSELTGSGEVMGTPAYMAPEQALGRGDQIGEATDVHALGAVLYECLTCRPPYGCDEPAEVLARLLRDEPVHPRKIDRRIPRDLETICLKALAKDPGERYATARTILEELRRFEVGEPIQGRRRGLFRHAVKFARRHWRIAWASAAAAALALAVGAWLFDKTFEEVLDIGEGQHVAGEHAPAVRTLVWALDKAPASGRRMVLDRIARCVGEVADPKERLDAAMIVLEKDPDISFRGYDGLLAQTLIARIRSKNANRSIASTPDADRPLLHLTARRLKVFLDGMEGGESERKEAGDALDAILTRLSGKKREIFPVTDSSSAALPSGTPVDLLKKAKDTRASRWQRGKAAYAAGRMLEAAGKIEEALIAYRIAFDLMRSVYPVYSGASHASSFHADAIEEPECLLLREVSSAVRRLDSSFPDPLRGGLRLKIEGEAIPEEIGISLKVTVCDPSIGNPDQGLEHGLTRTFPIKHPERTFTMGVADGRYNLSVRHYSSGWGLAADNARFDLVVKTAGLLELDFDALPGEVEVRGEVVELPPIHARLMDEIRLIMPANGAAMDLGRDVFRWSGVRGATSYRVHFDYLLEDKSGVPTYKGSGAVKVQVPILCLGTCPEGDVRYIRKHLSSGRTGLWSVEAFDASGRRIGRSLDLKSSFIVVRGLDLDRESAEPSGASSSAPGRR